MVEYAESQFKLHAVRDDGSTLKDHLEKIPFDKLTQEDQDMLAGPEFPSGFQYIWEWYMELSAGRSGGGLGPSNLTYEGIMAWKTLSCREVSSWEIDTIKMIDAVFLRTHFEKQRQDRARKQAQNANARGKF